MRDNKKEKLIEIIKSLVAEQVEAYVREHEIKAKEFSILERIIRIEELKAQREIISEIICSITRVLSLSLTYK